MFIHVEYAWFDWIPDMNQSHIDYYRHGSIVDGLGAVRPHVGAFCQVNVSWTQTTIYMYIHFRFSMLTKFLECTLFVWKLTQIVFLQWTVVLILYVLHCLYCLTNCIVKQKLFFIQLSCSTPSYKGLLFRKSGKQWLNANNFCTLLVVCRSLGFDKPESSPAFRDLAQTCWPLVVSLRRPSKPASYWPGWWYWLCPTQHWNNGSNDQVSTCNWMNQKQITYAVTWVSCRVNLQKYSYALGMFFYLSVQTYVRRGDLLHYRVYKRYSTFSFLNLSLMHLKMWLISSDCRNKCMKITV